MQSAGIKADFELISKQATGNKNKRRKLAFKKNNACMLTLHIIAFRRVECLYLVKACFI